MNRQGVNRTPKITYIVTAAMSAFFFRGQLAYMIRNGWDVEVISGPGPQLDAMRKQGARPWVVPMEREIAPLKDLLSLWRLWRLLCHTGPDLVVAGTPKAGFLGTIAARLAGVPHVVYTLHGLRLETALGWKRRLLWLTEWVACHTADGVRSISPSLRARAIALGLVPPKRCNVVGAGTSNGVDTEHWRRTPLGEAAGQQARERWGIPPGAPLVGFVGRLTRDKGVVDLYGAFKRLQPCHPDLRLLFVGDFEAGDPVPTATRAQIEADPAVVVTGFVSEVAPYYWTMDVLTVPTYREGMCGVLLEAQAASIPVVGTNATGAIDAVVDGVTGLQVPPGDVDALTAALNRLLCDSSLRARMGQAGCSWIQENFQREAVWQELLADYRSLIDGGARTARSALGSRS
jgi:glycosyltransferase involved in cell wall biosynthesis